MSIHKSYFDKSNTILYNTYTNTSRNPIVELFYGKVDSITAPLGFSRYIFNIDLSDLQTKITDGIISTGCTNFSSITHTLKMTNTSFFDKDLLNDKTSQGRRRATSFDLILFRIPNNQSWDSGVGYDYYDFKINILNDKEFSDRPSNWVQRSTINNWSTPGLYNNENSLTGGGVNYSAITIVDTQHFEFGNEDIEFNMTNEINSILSGGTTGVTGWGIAFLPQVENISGLTENYSVGFFSPYTQTFYEPYLETTYDDLILDKRNNFVCGIENELYLYAYDNGIPLTFDSNPIVDILDSAEDVVFSSLTSCLVTEGVYKVVVPPLSCSDAPCLYYDVWKNIIINGDSFDNVENEFASLPNNKRFKIGSTTENPKLFGFSFDGIKQNEKILNTDIRKVNVVVKQAYSSKSTLNDVRAFYRIYVREGANTEVQVQDWTRINQTPDGFYFVFDTRDKIPNEYFIDMKVVSDKNTDTYKRELQFQIVNKL
jgi:hypothetical protein